MNTAAVLSGRRSKRRSGKPQRRISAILRSLSVSRRDGITVGEISHAFDGRAIGAFFILFGGINLVPMPPGASFLFGLPLVFVATQLAFGRQELWLPERIRRTRMSADMLARIVTRIGPPLRRVERLARQRYWPRSEQLLGVAIGWFALLLAILVLIPMPFTNMFPGVAIALMGVAITMRDGYWLAAGVVVGLGSILFLIGFYGAAVLALLAII